MAEYIDRKAFLEHMKSTNRYFDVKFDIEDFPAADVAPVRRGKWVKIYENGEPAIEQHQVGVFCNKCMKMPKDKFTESDFCQNCGAAMDLEE